MARAELFLSTIVAQIKRNRDKWGDADRLKTGADYALIAQEQLGQLSKAILEGNPNDIHRECIHTAAMLYEIFGLVTPSEP